MHSFATSCISKRFSHRNEGLIFERGSNPDEEHANYFPAGLHGRFHCPAIAANKSVETNYCTAEATNKSVEVKFNHKLLLSSAYFTHSGAAEAEFTKTLEELDELICRNKGYNMIDANARMVVIQAELKTQFRLNAHVFYTNNGFGSVCVCDEHVERDQCTRQS